MSHFDHHSGRYYSSTPPPRHRDSRTDIFLDNLERGHFKDAVGAFLPNTNNKRGRSQRNFHRHHGYDDEYCPSDDDSFQYSEHRPSHHQHRHQDVDYYNYSDEKPRARGRSVHTGLPDSRRARSRQRHRARSVGGTNWRQATEAAVGAGLIEGWRSRHDGERAGRIVTAAAGAAGTAMLVGHEGDRKNKRHVVEATLGGLVIDRVLNGSRK